MRVSIAVAATHLCPYVDERDIGTVRASWDGDAVELHKVAEELRSWEDLRASHEAVTEWLCDYIASSGGVNVHVVTEWTTAGLAVTVEAKGSNQ